MADLISFAVLLAFLPSLPCLLLPAGTVGVFALKAGLLSTRLALKFGRADATEVPRALTQVAMDHFRVVHALAPAAGHVNTRRAMDPNKKGSQTPTKPREERKLTC